MVVAPATANILAKMAAGIADDLASREALLIAEGTTGEQRSEALAGKARRGEELQALRASVRSIREAYGEER